MRKMGFNLYLGKIFKNKIERYTQNGFQFFL
jgi:hypothetical protein